MAAPTHRNSNAVNTFLLIALVASVSLVAFELRKSSAPEPSAKIATEDTFTADDSASGVESPIVRQVKLSEATLRLREKARRAALSTEFNETSKSESSGNAVESASTTDAAEEGKLDGENTSEESTDGEPTQEADQGDSDADEDTSAAETEPSETQSIEAEPEVGTTDASNAQSAATPTGDESVANEKDQAQETSETDTPATNEQEDSESAGEPTKEEDDVAPPTGLVIKHRDLNSGTITLTVDGSVRRLRAGGDLSLDGDGPFVIRFIRGNQYATGPLKTPAGVYQITPNEAAWKLSPAKN
ncbi:MAG: hypothetical protein AAFV88_14550 [Planctomycetota bacterium]